ncbi:MAG: M3 family oligoendopeptidase [Planctomycetota bacterium]|jgi:oligoendopeptidase F
MAEVRDGVVWDLTSYFPAFDGPEMREFKEKLSADIESLQQRAGALEPLSADNAEKWENVYLLAEDAGARLGHVFSYVGCLSAADAANDAYSAEEAKLRLLSAEFGKFGVDLLRALRDVDDTVFTAFIAREKLAPVAHSIRRDRERARKQMTPPEEKLAADLGVDGIHAWGRLYDKVSGKLEFGMKWPDGKVETLPISRWRSLMENPDRAVGRAAFEGGNRAWAAVEDTCAATLNAISGTRLTLYARRGVEHFLETPLFEACTERETLDAMYSAIHENIEVAREIFRAKARKLGREGIAWFERDAPLPLESSETLSWERGRDMVGQAFETAYPALARYYREELLAREWVESEARGGKRPGAFCSGSDVTGEQRVYMTFNGSLGDASTLAHESGHAWHGHLMREMRPMAREYPMTLAETASIFAEHVFAEGVYADPEVPADAKTLMLDSELSGAATMLLDITVRFEFEKAFYGERAGGELSAARFRELMVETQKRVFGNALLDGGEDPLFWASKLHFYISGLSFYNFPYTFGFLLARSLYAIFKERGAEFLPEYEEFLRLAGSDTVEGVARRAIGADVSDPAFWARAIRSLEEPLARYRES